MRPVTSSPARAAPDGSTADDESTYRDGLTFTGCSWLNVSNCTLLDCGGSELVLQRMTDSQFGGCLIADRTEDDSQTIRATGCERVTGLNLPDED